MKHLKLTLSIAATALLTLPTFSVAADEKPEGKRPGGPGGRFSPEERLKRMTDTLGLTQEQQDKIKAIMGKGSDEMKALREKGRENLTEEDKTKMKEFITKQMEEIGAVLTPEQKEKWKTEMANRRPGGPEGGPRRGGEKKPESK